MSTSQSQSEQEGDPRPQDDRDLAIEGVLSEAATESSEPEGDALAQVKQEMTAAQQQTLRAQAELENVRKRLRRELQEERRYAIIPLVRELLPTIDSLERAIGAVNSDDCPSGFVDGLQMVASQIVAVLAQHHCIQIDPAGQAFDPMHHEAIAQQHSDDFSEGMVIQVVQVGYALHDRVVRPAHVIVSQGSSG